MSALDAAARLWTGPTLLLDAATRQVQAGILADGDWLAFSELEGEALETIFRSVSEVTSKSGIALRQLQSVAFGIGPGSILGLRLSLMALLTWRRLPEHAHWQCFQFHGLRLLADLHRVQKGETDFDFISGFRRGFWHHLPCRTGIIGPLEVLEDEQLADLEGPVYHLSSGRPDAVPPLPVTPLEGTFRPLPILSPMAWAEPVSEPALYLPAPPQFKLWHARRHR